MLELVIVRHGESVRNHAADLAHHGDTTLLEYQLRFEQDESSWDLTQRGVDQSKVCGTWIRENVGDHYDRQFVSPFKRARQTAACLELPQSEWRIEQRLRERYWGDYSTPGLATYTVQQYLQDLALCIGVTWKRNFPGAESIEDMIPRCQSFVHDLYQEMSHGQAIIVTHGGTMKSLQIVIERLGVEDAGLLAERHLNNCSVLHYRLENFSADGLSWDGTVRFATPTTPDLLVSQWMPLAGPKRS